MFEVGALITELELVVTVLVVVPTAIELVVNVAAVVALTLFVVITEEVD